MKSAKTNPPEIRSLFKVAEVELSYKHKVSPADRAKIYGSRDAYDVLMDAWDLNKIELVEHFMILLLDRANSCLGISHIATGGVSECIVDPKIVFATALKARATHIIAAHNHPSGSLRPSVADIQQTRKLVEGGKVLSLPVLDHMIISRNGYYSFGDEGLMP